MYRLEETQSCFTNHCQKRQSTTESNFSFLRMSINHFNVPHARCETFWQRKIQSRSVPSRLLIFLGPGVPCTAATGHLVISKSAYQRYTFKYFILRSKNDTTS